LSSLLSKNKKESKRSLWGMGGGPSTAKKKTVTQGERNKNYTFCALAYRKSKRPLINNEVYTQKKGGGEKGVTGGRNKRGGGDLKS